MKYTSQKVVLFILLIDIEMYLFLISYVFLTLLHHHTFRTLTVAHLTPKIHLSYLFQACSNDPSSQIAERVRQMRDLFVRKFEEVTSSFQSVADPRYTLGIKLYYRMLELMLNYVS